MDELKADLLKEASILRIPSGTAEMIAEKVLNAAEAWKLKNPTATKQEVTQFITKEIEKYHTDLAYVYQNRDKII